METGIEYKSAASVEITQRAIICMWNQLVTRILRKRMRLGPLGLIFISLFLNAGLSSVSQADDIPGLYETEISVSTQDVEERKAALTAGMRQVLLRVSGRSIVLTITAVEEALIHPTRYVQRYLYRNRAGAGGAQEKVLWVRFDEKAINQLLRDNRMPVWGRTRPAVLMWMVVDDRQSRILLGNNDSHPAKAFISEQAQLRGIPLRWPLLDLSDQSSITPSDVWGSFEDTIIKASRRYQTEAILVGRVYKSYSGSWNVRWTLYDHGHREDWDARAETLVETLIPGVDRTASILAQRFSQVEADGQNSQVLVQVYGVKTLPAYNKTLKYLSQLAVVTQVQAHTIAPDNVIFQMNSRNGRLAVSQAVALGHTLIEKVVRTPTPVVPRASTAPEQPVAKVGADLVYHLIQ
ncbi:hypothetical protein MNBD_GAMMA25-1709 [hydrothermal vent metagenome]|uniref:DUF2066 domain-containing protein n=1 Tax=hydrothermal vent metagenome TaxID=652676 RepID=A0A3B1AYU0_9ZZZZ